MHMKLNTLPLMYKSKYINKIIEKSHILKGIALHIFMQLKINKTDVYVVIDSK